MMRIGQVAPLWASVPPATYGGVERQVHLLTEGLVRRGHDVTLFASADSRTGAELRPVVARGLAQAMERGEAHAYEPYLNHAVADALRLADRFDVLHFHLGTPAIPLGTLSSAPVVHSVQSGITLDDIWMLERHPHAAVTAVSQNQLEPLPASRRRSIRVVPNSVDFGAWRLVERPGAHLVFLGRMGPHKGPDEAIRIAQRAGLPLVLAGAPLTAEERAYFEREVQPHVDGHSVVWVGAVDDAKKNELFEDAAALLFPIRWDEPFGIVMIEAMACGVPVIAWNRGSVPEVVEHGVTGFHVAPGSDLAAFVEPAQRLDRGAVRARACQRFGHERMVDRYLEFYGTLVAGHVTESGTAEAG